MEFAVGGVPVKFPCKPYPTQMAMMAKVLKQSYFDMIRVPGSDLATRQEWIYPFFQGTERLKMDASFTKPVWLYATAS